MTLLIERGPVGRRGMLAKRDPSWRPIRGEHGPDQVIPRDRSPPARVAGLAAVVAHEEVVALGHAPGLLAVLDVLVAALGRDVGLVELLAVDPDEALRVLAHGLAGEADQPLHERSSFAAVPLGRLRRVEDDDLAPVRVA